MAAALQVTVLCLICGLWFAAQGACAFQRGYCSNRCPRGWASFNSRCYQFQHHAKSWADAERHCTLRGGNLASIQAPGEYRFIRRLVFRATGRNCESWVGGHDTAKNNVWLWSDGLRFEFRGWGRGEPNNAGGEGCMEINFQGRDYVNDAKCYHRQPFICAKDP